MFRRGQKVRIIESNAKKRAHPATGNTGYLDNMFLFPKDHFILINLFMCSYGESDHRVERKNFVLDLGMHNSVKNKISRVGVNKLFFMEKRSINLNPTFFLTRKHRYAVRSYELVQAFPQLIGTYGIWPSYTSVSNERNRKKDSMFRIPCGRISICSEKKCRTKVNIKEFTAWIRSVSTEIISALQLFDHFYPSNGGRLNNHAGHMWKNINHIFHTETQFDDVTYLHFMENRFAKLTPVERLALINTVMQMRNMAHIAYERLTLYLIHRRSTEGLKLQYLKKHLSDGQMSYLLDPDFIRRSGGPVLTSVFITECLYRSLITKHCTADRLDQIAKFLPSDSWSLEQMAKDAEEIKVEADSNSAALNRIFELIKPKPSIAWSNAATTVMGANEWHRRVSIVSSSVGVGLENQTKEIGRLEVNMDKAEQIIAHYTNNSHELPTLGYSRAVEEGLRNCENEDCCDEEPEEEEYLDDF